MIIKNLQKNKGFVLLFAVTLAAILLSIALGVSNIALREIKFGTSAKDTNEAFFAADTGVEKVLFLDKDPESFPAPEEGNAIIFDTVYVPGLGNTGKSCAIVTITKDFTLPVLKTTIISKGYNLGGDDPLCLSTNRDRIERQLEVRY
ncbi:MAG: hypothetical protein WC870_01515 [Candidatus Paceibacterota bacterium]